MEVVATRESSARVLEEAKNTDDAIIVAWNSEVDAETLAPWLDALKEDELGLCNVIGFQFANQPSLPKLALQLDALSKANAADNATLRSYVRQLVLGNLSQPLRRIRLDEGIDTHRRFTDAHVDLIVHAALDVGRSEASDVRELSIAGNREAVGPDSVESIGRWISDALFCKLQALNLSQCSVGDAGVSHLILALEAASDSCTLQEIALACCGITDRGGEMIAAALAADQHDKKDAVVCLAPQLLLLDVEHNNIPLAVCMSLARAARRHPRLRSLKLSRGNDLRENAELRELLELPTLESGLTEWQSGRLRALFRRDPRAAEVCLGGGRRESFPISNETTTLLRHAAFGNSHVLHLRVDFTDSLDADALEALRRFVPDAVSNLPHLQHVALLGIVDREMQLEILRSIADTPTPGEELQQLTVPAAGSRVAPTLVAVAKALCKRFPRLTALDLTHNTEGLDAASQALQCVVFAAKHRFNATVGAHVKAQIFDTDDALHVSDTLVVVCIAGETSPKDIDLLCTLYRDLLPRAVSAQVTSLELRIVSRGGAPLNLCGAAQAGMQDGALWSAIARSALVCSTDHSTSASSAALLPALKELRVLAACEHAPNADRANDSAAAVIVRGLLPVFEARAAIDKIVLPETREPCANCRCLIQLEEAADCNRHSRRFRRLALEFARPQSDFLRASAGDDDEGDLIPASVARLWLRWTTASTQITSVDFSHTHVGNSGFKALVDALNRCPGNVRQVLVRNSELSWTDGLPPLLEDSVAELLQGEGGKHLRRLDLRESLGIASHHVQRVADLVGLNGSHENLVSFQCSPSDECDDALRALEGALGFNSRPALKRTVRAIVASGAETAPFPVDLDEDGQSLCDSAVLAICSAVLPVLSKSRTRWPALSMRGSSVKGSAAISQLIALAGFFLTVDLSSNRHITAQPLISALCSTQRSVMRTLRLANCELLAGSVEATEFASAVAQIATLRTVDVAGTGWSQLDQERIATAAYMNAMPSVTSATARLQQPCIRLQHVFITEPVDDTGLTALCPGLSASPFVKSLVLTSGELSVRAVENLCEVLSSPSSNLERVSLADCGLGDAHLAPIAVMLAMNPTRLRSLDIRSDRYGFRRFSDRRLWSRAIAAASTHLSDVLPTTVTHPGDQSPSRKLYWSPGIAAEAGADSEGCESSLAALVGAVSFFNDKLQDLRVVSGMAPLAEGMDVVQSTLNRCCQQHFHPPCVKRTLVEIDTNLPAVRVIDWSASNITDDALLLLSKSLWTAYQTHASQVTQLADDLSPPALPLVCKVDVSHNDAVTDRGLVPLIACLQDIEERRRDPGSSALRCIAISQLASVGAGTGEALCRLLQLCPSLQVDALGAAIPNAADVQLFNGCNLQPLRFRDTLFAFEGIGSETVSSAMIYEPREHELGQSVPQAPAGGITPMPPPREHLSPDRTASSRRGAPEPSYTPGHSASRRARASPAFNRQAGTLTAPPNRFRSQRQPQLNDLSCELLCDRMATTKVGISTHLVVLALPNNAIGGPGLKAVEAMLRGGDHPLTLLDVRHNDLDDSCIPTCTRIEAHLRPTLGALLLSGNFFSNASEGPFTQMLRLNSDGGVLQRFEVRGERLSPDVAARLHCAVALCGKSDTVKRNALDLMQTPPGAGTLIPTFQMQAGEVYAPSSLPSLLALGLLSGAFRFHGLRSVCLSGTGLTDAGWGALPFAGDGLWGTLGDLLINILTACHALDTVDLSCNKLSCQRTLAPFLEAARLSPALLRVDLRQNTALTEGADMADFAEIEAIAANDCIDFAVEACHDPTRTFTLGPWCVEPADGQSFALPMTLSDSQQEAVANFESRLSVPT